jgi:hypothetical protein
MFIGLLRSLLQPENFSSECIKHLLVPTFTTGAWRVRVFLLGRVVMKWVYVCMYIQTNNKVVPVLNQLSTTP